MPVYRAARKLWYVEARMRQSPLGHHPEGLPETKKSRTRNGVRGEWNPPEEMMRAYYRVITEPNPGKIVPAAVTSRAPPEAEELVEDLGWLQDQPDKAEGTVSWYATYCRPFSNPCPSRASSPTR